MHAFQALVRRFNHGKRLQGRDVHDGVVVDLLQALDVIDSMCECHWQEHTVIILITKHAMNYGLALLNHVVNPLLAFGIVFRLLLLHARNDALGECRGEHHVLRVAARHVVVRVNLVQAQVHQRHDLALHFDGVNAVLAVAELNDAALVVAHRHVVLNLQILHALDESALDISSRRGFHSGVNETHATTHGVKEELLRREPRNEGVLHEAARARGVVVLREVRQRAVLKPVGDALAVNELLSEARNHLRNVQIAALGTRLDHGHEAVVLVQALQPDFARVVRGLVQNVGDLELKLVLVGVARRVLKDAEIRLVNQVLHLLLFRRDGLRDLLVGAAVGNQVADADAVSAALHVLRDDVLQVVNEVGCRHVAKVVASARDEAVAASAEHVLVQLPAQILAVHDLQHAGRGCKVVVFTEALGLVFHGECRHDLRQDLEAGDAIRVAGKQPFVDPIVRHQQIHGIARRERHTRAGQTVRTQ